MSHRCPEKPSGGLQEAYECLWEAFRGPPSSLNDPHGTSGHLRGLGGLKEPKRASNAQEKPSEGSEGLGKMDGQADV